MISATRSTIAFLIIAACSSSASAQSADGASTVDLTQLVEHTSADGAVLARNTVAYDALNVPAMSAGSSFSDPVTGVRTVKVTDARTPADTVTDTNWVTLYSSMGLQISQAWGPDNDRYTIIFNQPVGNAHLADYKLGGTVTNYRKAPEGEGQTAFARSAGNERILYYVNGTHLNRYDTQTNSLANTGDFPFAWPTDNNATAWFNMNADDTRACAHDGRNTIATALDLTTGAVITRPATAAQHEPYCGSGHTAFLNKGANWPPANVRDEIWDLRTNTVSRINHPYGTGILAVDWGGLSHSATPYGDMVFHFDINHGGGNWPSINILSDNTYTTPAIITGYWSDTHSSGHWWDLPAGYEPHVLMSHDQAAARVDTPSWESTLMFVNTTTGSKRILGHHYAIKPSGIPGGASTYYDESHATISTDGKLVMFSSTMNKNIRRDVFLMEVPRTATTVGARPLPPTLED